MTTDACAALVERGDPDRFAAIMAAPPLVRARLWPIFAFNLEVARAPWLTQEPLIAQMRLQWWRDALEEIGAGGRVRAHEVVGPLAPLIREAGLPVALFDAVIVARHWDIEKAPFADEAAFAAHIDATAGNLLWLAALSVGAAPALEPAVRDAGFAAGLASWFQAVPELEARGRYPLPDGRPEAVKALAQTGLARLRHARRARFGVAVPVMRTTWRAGDLLAQAARQPGRVADGTLGTSEFRRRGTLAVRTLLGRW